MASKLRGPLKVTVIEEGDETRDDGPGLELPPLAVDGDTTQEMVEYAKQLSTPGQPLAFGSPHSQPSDGRDVSREDAKLGDDFVPGGYGDGFVIFSHVTEDEEDGEDFDEGEESDQFEDAFGSGSDSGDGFGNGDFDDDKYADVQGGEESPWEPPALQQGAVGGGFGRGRPPACKCVVSGGLLRATAVY
jgi:hypothetical protein